MALAMDTGMPVEYWAAPHRYRLLDTALAITRERNQAAADPRGMR